LHRTPARRPQANRDLQDSAGTRPSHHRRPKKLHSFAAGIRRDLQAVTAGLTLPYSSGAAEGNVNRIKMIKRQMYGRAGLSLLRKRVLLAA